MCGIAGILNGQGASADAAERMAAQLRHRGPDGYGIRQFGPATLIHTRLSIIDLATGDQPLANEDESVWITFNGEVFNYVELREELERLGHRFRTRSDTETIVHAYEQWGDDCLARLNGQFAFAIWDIPRQRLLLARDRVGVRPLFYRRKAGAFYFASEIKAFPAESGGLEIDPRGFAQVFTFWSTVGTRTVFRDVSSLPPGHLMVIENGRESMRRYWDWQFPRAADLRRISLGDAAAELRELLQDAVRLQLRSDVPVGAYLSGGLDSSGIAAMARQDSSVKLRTFSVTFSDAEFDESAHQQAMADYLGTAHSSLRCSGPDIAAAFPRLIRHTETPILRTGPAPLMLLSGFVRDSGFKVVLTGEGADEVFGGYDLFKEGLVRRFWSRQPKSSWRPAIFARLYPYLRNSPVSNRGFAQQFFGQDLANTANPFYGHVTRWSTTRRTWAFLSDEVRSALNGWSPEEDLHALLPPDMQHWQGLARDQYVEASTLLYGYLLSSQGDRVAMANSVEGRVPYLDHRVIEFANALPARLKLRGLQEKAVLKAALGPLLPSDIIGRTKQPYRAPDSASFFVGGDTLEYVKSQFSERRLAEAGLFSPAAARQLFEKCRAGKAIGFPDNMAFTGILSAMLLDEQFVQGREI